MTGPPGRSRIDELAAAVVDRYQSRPLHLLGTLGLGIAVLGVGALAYLSVIKLMGGAVGHRPLLLLGTLLVVAGVQMLSIGLLGELIALLQAEERQGYNRDVAEVKEVLR